MAVYNQEVVDWMKQLTVGQVVDMKLRLGKNIKGRDTLLTRIAIRELAMEKYNTRSPEVVNWTQPTLHDAGKAIRAFC